MRRWSALTGCEIGFQLLGLIMYFPFWCGVPTLTSPSNPLWHLENPVSALSAIRKQPPARSFSLATQRIFRRNGERYTTYLNVCSGREKNPDCTTRRISYLLFSIIYPDSIRLRLSTTMDMCKLKDILYIAWHPFMSNTVTSHGHLKVMWLYMIFLPHSQKIVKSMSGQSQ